MASERRALLANPENLLIDLLADEIERDEQLIEALGSGTVALEDLERWHSARGAGVRGFVDEARRLIAEMRAQGFQKNMRRTGDRTASKKHAGGPLKFGEHAPKAPEAKREARPAGPGPRRFYLDLKDIGAGCRLRLSGDYEDILDAGAWHLRHAHKLHGSEASVRELVETAISEVPTARLSLEERTHGLRTEESVSDEMANRSRPAPGGPPFASA